MPGYNGPRILGFGKIAGTAGNAGGIMGDTGVGAGSGVNELTVGGGGTVL